MSETRLIQKQLAGKEDLLLGIGKATQKRASGDREITKLNVTELQGALVVETIEDLENLDLTKLSEKTVIVKDIARGGIFIYDSTKVGEDNQGTNFNGWLRQYEGAVNVKWFGAVGDGVTDDTDAIQRAIDLGKSVLIVGNYCYSNTINITNSIDIHIDGMLKYIGGYALSNPHFNVSADSVNFYNGIFDGNFDIGSIIQFDTTTTGGSVTNSKFKNLLSKTELGSASGDFACIVMKGTECRVNNCKFNDIVNTDAVTTNDSFPRAITITGSNNFVSNIEATNTQCVVTTTGNRNRISSIKAYNISDNGVYYGGTYNYISDIYFKDMKDEPIVFIGGSNNTVERITIDNSDTDYKFNAIGFQNATNCTINGLYIPITAKCANLLKARIGNTQSSFHINDIQASVSSVHYSFNFVVGNTDYTISNSKIEIVKQSGFDSDRVLSGGSCKLLNVDFIINSKPGYTTSVSYLYFSGVDRLKSYGSSIEHNVGGYSRDVPWALSKSHMLSFSNTWGQTLIMSGYPVPKEVYLDSIPTTGIWSLGDKIIKMTPTAGGNIGWVCTVAGTPGTWKAFGTISA